METIIVYRGYIGVYRGYIGLIYLGFRFIGPEVTGVNA